MRLLNVIPVATALALILSGCSVHSKLSVTNSTVINQANFRVVKPLHEKVSSTHFLTIGGWKVRDAKENVIQKWQAELEPNQALADINFTETYSHLIPYIFYRQSVSISAIVVAFDSGCEQKNGMESVQEQKAPLIMEGTLFGPDPDELDLEVPPAYRSLKLASGEVIDYNPDEPINDQIIKVASKAKQAFMKHRNRKGRTLYKNNIVALKKWCEFVPSKETQKAIKELENVL